MEILVNGRKIDEREWYGECYHCDAILKAKESELDHISTACWVADCLNCRGRVQFYCEHTQNAEDICKKIPF